MKTKLLKFALCAMALLPMGAWAVPYTWNFNGTVSEADGYATKDATHWEWKGSRWYYKTATSNNCLMLGANEFALTKGLLFTTSATNLMVNNSFIQIIGSVKIRSLAAGATVTVYAKANGKSGETANYLTASNLTPRDGCFAGHGADTGWFTETGTVTANGDVTLTSNLGTVNIQYISITDGDGKFLSKDQFYALNLGNGEYSVSTTKTWTFDGLTTDVSYDAVTAINDEYYLRGATSPNRTLTVANLDAEKTLTFSDGYTIKVNKCLSVNSNVIVSGMTDITAAGNNYSSSNLIAAGGFAFKTTVGGTLYVYMSNNVGAKKLRIYFNGTANKTVETSVADAITEVVSTATAAGGTFIFGGAEAAFKIYAVRFVPTCEKMDEWVYIGETGYATWGNTSNKDIESLPTGLTAYKAAAGTTSVTLTSLDKMRRGSGYVIKGTPYTNYGLSYGGTTVGEDYKGGDMVAVTADMEDFAATNGKTGDELRNRYILGNDNGTAKFFTPSGSGTLKKGKAYLQTKKTLKAGSRGIEINFEDDTTSINKKATLQAEDGKWYNLQGIEVALPTKGIYIRNGKKVVIK